MKPGSLIYKKALKEAEKDDSQVVLSIQIFTFPCLGNKSIRKRAIQS